MNGLRSALVSLDSSVLEWMHQHATPAGVSLFLTISRFGSPEAMTILAIAGALILAWRREWIVLGGWTAAFVGGSALEQWLKLTVHRARPPYAAALLKHPTWSFPSGHALGALVGYGMVVYVLLLLGHRWGRRTRFLIVGAAALVITTIGVSRLYLGVHYFSDVVGGYVAGVLWLSVCITGVEFARRSPAPLNLHPTG